MQRAVLTFGMLLAAGPSAPADGPPVVAPKPAGRPYVWATMRDGETGSRWQPVASTPEPLSVPPDAVPLDATPQPPDASDRSDVPDPLPPREAADPQLDALLDRYLPGSDAQEKDVWREELQSLPPAMVRDILSTRRPLGSPFGAPFGSHFEPRPMPSDAAVPLAEPAMPADASARTRAALERAAEIVRHNVANAETVAFKRCRPVFHEAAGVGGLDGVAVQRTDEPGECEETGRPLDFAVVGAGWFRVRNGEAAAVTRRGTFRLTADRQIALEAGGRLWSLDPIVTIPAEATAFVVAADGGVGFTTAGDATATPLGQIGLVRVTDADRLEPLGGGLFALPDDSNAGLPGRDGLGSVRQGHLERSNVNLDSELRSLARIERQLAVWRGNPPAGAETGPMNVARPLPAASARF